VRVCAHIVRLFCRCLDTQCSTNCYELMLILPWLSLVCYVTNYICAAASAAAVHAFTIKRRLLSA